MNSCLLGGVALTYLRVYEQRPGPDGANAGCAHVHGLSDEAYYCIAGEGAVELHDPQRGLVRHPMRQGSFLQFPPGTLHRSVSYRQCEFLVIMGNGGLPEHGDARIYFGPEVDADPEVYRELQGLASSGLEGALARRDASAGAYRMLLGLWEEDREAYHAELTRFCRLHLQQIGPSRARFERLIREGAGKALETSLERVRNLPEASPPSPVQHVDRPGLSEVFGMCGVLRQISPSSSLLPLVGSNES